jgi:hypothetical protein
MSKLFNNVSNHEEGIDLSGFEEDFQKAKVWDESTAAAEIPDGYYDVCIEEARLSRAVSSGNPMLVWRMRILGPDHAGRNLYKRRAITTRTLGFLKEDLQRCGLHLERLSELEFHLSEMQDRQLGVFKKTRGGYTDIHFSRNEKPLAELDDNLPF